MEKVPFRLTANIIDGMGVTGIEGKLDFRVIDPSSYCFVLMHNYFDRCFPSFS